MTTISSWVNANQLSNNRGQFFCHLTGVHQVRYSQSHVWLDIKERVV